MLRIYYIGDIKRYQEIMYTFTVWPTKANIYIISGYLFIGKDKTQDIKNDDVIA